MPIKSAVDSLIFSLRERWRRYNGTAADRVAIPATLAESRTLLQSILLENILPFWLPRAPDPAGAGYRLHHDNLGDWKGPAPKTLVAQSRTLWYFARVAAEGLEHDRHLEAARTGFRFLQDCMWDAKHGGFFWQVDVTGRSTMVPDKLLYGQAFALYALSQYATVSADPAALPLARETWEIVDRKLHDPAHGGYLNAARRDWDTRPRSGTAGGREIPGPKRMNSHLHLMEALTAYCSACDDPLARDRLRELIMIQSDLVVRKSVGACMDLYEPDWSPVRTPEADRVSYGHDTENIVLLMQACEMLGMSDGRLLDLYRTLMDSALRCGYDRHYGGFFRSGKPGEPADRREKLWWVQAEALTAALAMFARTGEPRYEDCYLRTLGWIAGYQVDWRNGDWYAAVDARGHASGDKASEWKGPYHNARAVLNCLELLAEPERKDSQG